MNTETCERLVCCDCNRPVASDADLNHCPEADIGEGCEKCRAMCWRRYQYDSCSRGPTPKTAGAAQEVGTEVIGKAKQLRQENDSLKAYVGVLESDAHLAREAMAAVQEDLAKYRAVVAELSKERDSWIAFGAKRIDEDAKRIGMLTVERDAAIADASRARTLLAEALSFATCSGFDLNERYGRYLELCAIAGALASKNGDGE